MSYALDRMKERMGSEGISAGWQQSHVEEDIAKLTQDDLEALDGDPTSYEVIIHRMREVRRCLNGLYAEKEEIVELLMACAVAQVPMVLLGPPGTAKSALVRSFCETLGLRAEHENIGQFEQAVQENLQAIQDSVAPPKALRKEDRPLFEYLVTRYTTPEEILGTVNIDAMLKLSMFFRDSRGMLPKAHIAFLDEIFKANSAILNALLSIINERIYYNAGRAFDVDLVTIYGASNEAPDTEELAALYDRFPIRAVSDPVRDSAVDRMMANSVEMAYDRAVRPSGDGGQPTRLRPIAAVNDFRLLSRINYVKYGGRELFFGDGKAGGKRQFSFAAEFKGMFKALRDEFGISDRTPERLLRVAKALALLEGAEELTPDHLRVFQYCAPNAEAARVLREVVAETIEGMKANV